MNFLKIIFPSIILIISFLLLIYTLYKSELIWNGDKRDYYKKYYLISSILICFSIITFFINDIIKQYLIILGISLIVLLYLFEGYLTLNRQFSKEQISKKQLLKEQLYEKQTGKKWDKRKKVEIYKDLKKKIDNITISFFPSNFIWKYYSNVLFPLSGLSNIKTIYCNENGYYSIYQADRHGFNNPDSEWDKKEIEYLLAGDSFVHGACINRPNDISSVLRNLSKKSILNLGMGGNGPLIKFATLREYLNIKDTKVKKVLWFYYEGNDLINLGNEKKNNILNNYLKDLDFTQNLKFKHNDIDNLLSNLIEERFEERQGEIEREITTFKIKLISFIKIYYTRISILTKLKPKTEPATVPELKQILQLTKELVNKNNSKLYFVYLPKYYRYAKTYDNTNYNLIKNAVTELKIPFIDIHKEIFEKEQNPLELFPFKQHGHYTVSGYKKVSETIYRYSKD